MSENKISNNVEMESLSIIKSFNDNSKEKEKNGLKHNLEEQNKIEPNIIEDDSNALLINNNSLNNQNGIFDFKLYIKYNKYFRLCKMTKIGKSYSFFYDKNGDPLIIIGPNWPYCIILFIFSTLVFTFIYFYYNEQSSTIIKFSDWMIFLIWSISYFAMCMKNPGYPKTCPESIKGTKEMSYCDKCEIWYKPSSSTIHCEICDICIEGFSYHCFWAGHCIGANNKIEFYLFLFISLLFPIYLMFNISIIGKH